MSDDIEFHVFCPKCGEDGEFYVEPRHPRHAGPGLQGLLQPVALLHTKQQNTCGGHPESEERASPEGGGVRRHLYMTGEPPSVAIHRESKDQWGRNQAHTRHWSPGNDAGRQDQ